MRRMTVMSFVPAILAIVALLAAPAALAAPAPGKDACKNGGHRALGYSNQGQCVSAANAAARRGEPFPPAPPAPPPPQCSNGADDDTDGRTDFPADPGCSSASDNSESPDPPAAFGADLAVSIADSPDPAASGSPVTFTVTAANNGPQPDEFVIVRVFFPFGTFIQSNPGCNLHPGGAGASCFVNHMDPGTTRPLVFTVFLPPGPAVTTATINDDDGVQPDPNPSNNEDEETTLVTPGGAS